jgi:peptide/nickel transport system permease protein
MRAKPGARSLQARAIGAEVIESEFVRYARASGLGERRVRWMVLRNSLVPILTFVGTEIIGLLGTSSLIELIFSWGGIGQWGLQAILNGDFAAVQGYVLFAALLSVVVFLIIDIAVWLLEPRGRSAA